MRWRMTLALLMWLVLPGCGDADRDLPSPYRHVAVPEAQLTSAAARERGRVLFEVNCALCHGVRGDGMASAGKAWTSRRVISRLPTGSDAHRRGTCSSPFAKGSPAHRCRRGKA
jgi:mono/diheme cytochrome c family protein